MKTIDKCMLDEIRLIIENDREFINYKDSISPSNKFTHFFFPMEFDDIITTFANYHHFKLFDDCYKISKKFINKLKNNQFGVIVLPNDVVVDFVCGLSMPSLNDIRGDWINFIKEYHEYISNDALIRTFRYIERIMLTDLMEDEDNESV